MNRKRIYWGMSTRLLFFCERPLPKKTHDNLALKSINIADNIAY